MDEEGGEETLLGTFSYDREKEPAQTFPLPVREGCVGKTPGQMHGFASKSMAEGVWGPTLAERDVAGFGGLSSTLQGQQKQSEPQVGPMAVRVPRAPPPPMPAASATALPPHVCCVLP